MTTLIRKLATASATGLLALLPGVAATQVADLDFRLPMSIDADSTQYDGKTSTVIFNGLRLSQGHVGIQADEGRAKRMELEDSSWLFAGNVVIEVENGRIESDAANLMFDEFELKLATVTGSPATFRISRAGSEEDTYAEAQELAYDVANGVVEFSGDATITEGGSEISSSFLVYNIVEQRITAEGSGAEDDRVRFRYIPTNGEDAAVDPDDTAAEEDSENP